MEAIIGLVIFIVLVVAIRQYYFYKRENSQDGPTTKVNPDNLLAGTESTTTVHAKASESPLILALSKRYQDAYTVAKVTDGIGGTIKGFGIVLVVIIWIVEILIGFALASQTGTSGEVAPILIVALVFAGILAFMFGALFYLIGVVVSAQGQVLKATLDNTVGSSPFLNDGHKAQIMSLPVV